MVLRECDCVVVPTSPSTSTIESYNSLCSALSTHFTIVTAKQLTTSTQPPPAKKVKTTVAVSTLLPVPMNEDDDDDEQNDLELNDNLNSEHLSQLALPQYVEVVTSAEDPRIKVREML